ncbi:hypothetical protein [Nocardia sp. NPDC059239]|uniref:hypothetical protein n=1 Tax=unclassified Nocardia TaxID=2637762 RepID=UPI003699ED77
MTLQVTDRSITSDVTPEIAYHIPDPGGGNWVLTWLPGRLLTREQALEGMRLDELLSDPLVDGTAALRSAAERAAALGLDLPEVVVRLATRIAERDRWRAARPPHRRAHGPRCAKWMVPHRVLIGCLSLSAVPARTLYAVATLPSLSLVVAALVTARVTGNGWSVTGVSVATSALIGALTLAGSH